jgi:oxygen-independent coproporphyrinogen-3 oxidase
MQQLVPEYIGAICKELEYISISSRRDIPIHTIYFGGGTPSLIPSSGIEHIINSVKKFYALSPNPEITLEANPGTLSVTYLGSLGEVGVNRVSLGMQSALPEELALLERQHSFDDVVNAAEWVKMAGIPALNLDLIFGLPGQALDHWMASLEAAIGIHPEHLSLYALTLEHGTPLKHKVETGMLSEPDPDLAADMYEAGRDRLCKAGFRHYEISNWARVKDHGELWSCRHNLQYWRTLPYIGVGAGAHGFFDGYRTVNITRPRAYIQRLQDYSLPEHEPLNFPTSPATIQTSQIDQSAEIGEFMMMGLRLVEEGISDEAFLQRYGVSLAEKFGAQIDRLTGLGLLEWFGKAQLRLTIKGQLLGNQVFREFI